MPWHVLPTLRSFTSLLNTFMGNISVHAISIKLNTFWNYSQGIDPGTLTVNFSKLFGKLVRHPLLHESCTCFQHLKQTLQKLIIVLKLITRLSAVLLFPTSTWAFTIALVIGLGPHKDWGKLWPGTCFSKLRKLFGRIWSDIILFVSSKLKGLEARNFAVGIIFIPFTTYEKTSFTE